MPERIIEFMEKVITTDTTLGKVMIGLDTFGVMLSIGYYGFHIGETINSIMPPVVLVLTAISIFVSTVFKCASEYRAWKKRKTERK